MTSTVLFHKKIGREELKKKLGLLNVREEVAELAISELQKIIKSRSELAILEALTEEDRLEFMHILQNKNAILAASFLRKRLPGLRDLFVEVAERTIKEFMRIRGLA